jgi:O-antigen ligase
LRRVRVVELLFLATCFSVTFEKLHWNLAGAVSLADVLTILFLIAFAGTRLAGSTRRVPKTTFLVLAFTAAFLLVYLVGFFNLDTAEALSQWSKGLVKFVIHFLFLAAGVAYLARRSTRFYLRTVGWLAAGIGANALYGIVQLLFARGGHNLDATVLSPLTGGASAINTYGAVNGAKVYRPNALTGDPNHLGIMLIVPLLVLTPVYLRMRRGHAQRLRLGLFLGFLLLVEVLTLSRSGLLGLAVGALVLALPYRRRVLSRSLLLPLGAVGLLLAGIAATRWHYVSTIVRTRFETGGKNGESAHFGVYGFIPDVLHSHPLFGLGLNNFSVFYEFVTGKTNWGPHSFYVALIVETGVVGTLVFAAFLGYLFVRLHATLALGRALAVAGDRRAATVRPLAWGMTAALLGTLAANTFYLTMQFYYFYAFVALALALPVVFGRGAAEALVQREPPVLRPSPVVGAGV